WVLGYHQNHIDEMLGSVERLVNNLCTIWVGRLKLNANIERFNRENLKSSRIVDKAAKRFNKSSHNTFHKTVENKDIGNSFVKVVKGSGMPLETKSTPTIVLDDEYYFVIIRGLWLKSRIKLMIVVVYAPQEASEKRMLWDYLTHVSDQWDGEIVMMGDFNEVRYKLERFGSNFKAHDVDIFNSFIHNAGLNEVHL
nr:RNA-directed DNA polymerase, eukaryota [Tanacetum cinerariifolium]